MQPSASISSKPRRTGRKILTVFILGVLLIACVFVWWHYYYTYSDGYRYGLLQKFSHKGNVFKTYEGKLIQSGLRSRTPGTVASYEFEFSVEDDSVANVLMLNSGKVFELHYKEYLGTIPWRGHSKYVVDKIINMKEE